MRSTTTFNRSGGRQRSILHTTPCVHYQTATAAAGRGGVKQTLPRVATAIPLTGGWYRLRMLKEACIARRQQLQQSESTLPYAATAKPLKGGWYRPNVNNVRALPESNNHGRERWCEAHAPPCRDRHSTNRWMVPAVSVVKSVHRPKATATAVRVGAKTHTSLLLQPPIH